MPLPLHDLFEVIDSVDVPILADYVNTLEGLLAPGCALPPAKRESLMGLLEFLTHLYNAIVMDHQ